MFYANAWSNNLFNTNYIICGKNKISTNHDDGQLQFFKLKEFLEKVGCVVSQVFTIENLPNFDYLICYDPLLSDLVNLKKYPKNKLILFIWEPPVVKNTNYSKDLHEPFSKNLYIDGRFSR